MIEFEIDNSKFFNTELVPYSYRFGNRRYAAMYYRDYEGYVLDLFFINKKRESYTYIRQIGWVVPLLANYSLEQLLFTWDEIISIVSLDIL